MRAFTSLLLALSSSYAGFSTAAPVQPRDAAPTLMTLRVLTGPTTSPYIEGYVQVVDSEAGVGGDGFSSYINQVNADGNPIVQGALYKKADSSSDEDTPAYLAPTDTDGLYDFRFGFPVPQEVGTLSQDFVVEAINCGGNCGGLGVGYSTAAGSSWLATADETFEGGYKLRWFNGTSIPAGHTVVYMWRN